MKLRYGGSILPISSINTHLDAMKCTGKKSFYPSELASAERRLLKANAIKMKNELLEKISFISVSLYMRYLFLAEFSCERDLHFLKNFVLAHFLNYTNLILAHFPSQ